MVDLPNGYNKFNSRVDGREEKQAYGSKLLDQLGESVQETRLDRRHLFSNYSRGCLEQNPQLVS